ncbi:MAG: deoxyhypusine synthase [Candidatus Altiarchaeales archaeon ex4484_43]|nr:MAG: deoxyhypusine synthase [Candidatus Altiarchaeales archaeon ex4484_43]
MKPIKDIELREDIDELIEQMYNSGGFTAKKFALGIDILERMNREECTRFLSFPACIIATGVRGVIREFLRKKLVDVVITTTGTLDHDLARIWRWEIGKRLEREKNKESSIVYWSWKNKIPIFIPGIMDGAVGSQLWFFWQGNRDLKIDLFLDEQRLSDIVFNSKKTGALIIGGGISKHHTLWWNQFRDGLDYTVYITTANEFDGSLSGARTREAISWSQVGERAKHVTIDGDATLILPFMSVALLRRLRLR